MKRTLVANLCCPECELPLRVHDGNGSEVDVVSGALQCDRHHGWPIINGIPRFIGAKLPADIRKTQQTFSWEWRMYREGERNWGQDIATRRELFLRAFGLPAEKLKGKLLLDAGCGSGVLSQDIANKFGLEVIAVDLASGIERASERNTNPRVHYVQGSVLQLPVRQGVFDFVYCAGVLVHLPDSYEGFKSIIRALKPGGRCFVWVYHPIDERHHPTDLRKMRLYVALRKITTRLPFPVQSALYWAATVLFVIKRSVGTMLGTEQNRRTAREKMQNLFDTFSPIYQNRHEEDEVVEWFKSHGFSNVQIAYQEHYGFGVRGDKGDCS